MSQGWGSLGVEAVFMGLNNGQSDIRHDYYISYADDGREWVKGKLRPMLDRHGKRVFLEGDIEAVGGDWLAEMQKRIQQSHKVILVLTPQYLLTQEKKFLETMAMTKGAEEHDWPLIPIILEEVSRDLLLRTLRVIDLTKADQHVLLERLLGVSTQTSRPEPVPCPYPGMAAFTREQADYFYGREKEVETYVDCLRRDRCLVLIGPSGCGKSSVIYAGVIPELGKVAHAHQFGNGNWLVKSFRPSDGRFQDWVRSADASREGADERGSSLLSAELGAQHILLHIDQFEELFALDVVQEDRKRERLGSKASGFLQDMALLARAPNVYLVISLRDEFYPQLALCKEWFDFYSYLQPVSSLGRAGLADAIRKPAENTRIKMGTSEYGVIIEAVLVERLLNEAGEDPGILPFVQETMRALWAKRDECLITLEHYESLGDGKVSGLKHSIAATADSAFWRRLPSDEHRDIARRIFIRLVQFGEGKPDTRRQQSVSSLRSDQDKPGVFEETLRILSSENNRLLVISGEKGEESKVDIVHESLITAWPALRSIIRRYGEYDKKRRIYNFKYSEWVRLGKGESGLLDGKELDEIKEWLSSNSEYVKISGIGACFLSYIRKSEKNINPGYNHQGLFYIFLYLLGFFFLFGILVLMLIEANSISSWFLSLIIFSLALIYFFLIVFKREDKFVFQKISNEILFVKFSRISAWSLICVSLMLWGSIGWSKLDDEIYCSQEYENKDGKKFYLGVVVENKNLYFNGFEENLNKSSDIGFSYLLNESDKDRCKGYFTNLFEFNDLKSVNSGKEVSASGYLYPDGILIESIVGMSEFEECSILSGIANKLASKIRKDNVKISDDDQLGVSKSCIGYHDYKNGIDQLKENNIVEAKASFNKAIKEYHDFNLARYMLADILIHEKRYNEAIDLLVDAERGKLGYSSSLAIQTARACLRDARLDCAEEYYGKAMSYGSKDLAISNGLAVIARQRKNYLKSLQILDDAMNKNKDNDYLSQVMIKNKGVALYYMGKYEDAINYLSKYRSGEFLKEVSYYLSKSYENLKDDDKACEYARKYYSLDAGEGYISQEMSEDVVKC